MGDVRFKVHIGVYDKDTKELIYMKNNIIELSQYRSPEPFDFAAYNRRAAVRFRNSEARLRVLHYVETAVTAAIGVCSLCCVYLAFTML